MRGADQFLLWGKASGAFGGAPNALVSCQLVESASWALQPVQHHLQVDTSYAHYNMAMASSGGHGIVASAGYRPDLLLFHVSVTDAGNLSVRRGKVLKPPTRTAHAAAPRFRRCNRVGKGS